MMNSHDNCAVNKLITVVTQRGQVSIPAPIRKELGLEPGSLWFGRKSPIASVWLKSRAKRNGCERWRCLDLRRDSGAKRGAALRV